MNNPENVPNRHGLRFDAEEKLRNGPELPNEAVEAMSPERMQVLIHEMRVHQIELEMQNEELRRTQAELDESRSRYFDLYDLAPVGYCTLNDHGLIVECNLTLCNLLGMTRNSLHMALFSLLIEPEDQNAFFAHRRSLSTSDGAESHELRLRRSDGSSIWMQIVSSAVEDDCGAIRQRIVLTDITAIKAAECALRDREQFHLSIFDSLFEHIAVLDENGVITAVNEAWRRFSRNNGGTSESTNPIGVNYLQLCEEAGEESGGKICVQLAKAMRAILDGHQSEFSYEYECHAPGQRRWFFVHMTRMLGAERGVVVSHLDVTNRKHAELALEESRRELVLVATHVPGPVARIDKNLRYVFANSHYQKFFGKSTEDVIGQRMPDILGAELFQQVEPSVRRALAGEQVTLELSCRFPDHKGGHALVNYVPYRDADENVIGVFAVAIDITERKQAEEARNEALKILQKVTSRVPGAVYQFRFHPDGRFSMPYASQGLYSLFGVSPDEVVDDAAKVFALSHPDDLSGLVTSIIESAQEMTPWNHEFRFLVDEKVKWMAGNAAPEREPDGSVLWHGFVTDVTERVQAEAARVSLESQLRESQKMEAIGTLAGGIAHDFNNALAVILGNAELALREVCGNASLSQYIDEINRSAIRSRNLVHQILSYCRQQPTELCRVPLASVVDDAVAMLKATIPVKYCLTVGYAEEPCWILADKTQIEQVIINLVTNAAQALGDQSGAIDICVELVNSNAPEMATCLLPAGPSERTGRVVRLTVKDNGRGIAPEIRDRIFEPFFTTKPVGEGTGLGLSVVQGIVKLHGASIKVDSEPGRGTEFRVYFPEFSGDSHTRPPETIPAGHLSTTEGLVANRIDVDGSGRNVLLIDDDEAVLRILTLMLENMGYTVSAYCDPLAALDAIRNNTAAFQLVITDYNIPAMAGLEIATAVCELCPNLPVAVASGYVDDQLRAGAARAGVAELISKPFTFRELAAKVEQMLK